MAQTVIGKRFRSVFVASLASMSISYVLILTDNIVAGQFIGEDAVAAMTLVSPLMTLVFFLSYMVADGLAMMFSYAKGHNDRVKANDLFGMGVIASVALGVVLTIVFVAFDEKILSVWKISPELMTYALEYYHGLMFVPLPALLNIYFYTIYIAEGEENICVQASAAMFIVNVVLDIVLGYKIGVVGIGIATTIGNLVSFLWHVPYLFSKKCQLKFVRYWNNREFAQGIFYSWYHSMDTLCLALLPLIFAEFTLRNFGEDYLIVVTVIINLISLLIAIYTGIVDCLQPMICQYHAENALHSVTKTMRLGISSTIAVTLAIIVFGMIFAEFLPGLFGVNREEILYADCVFAARIFLPFTLFLGVVLMFANYYIYIERLNLGALLKFLLLLILLSAGMFAGVYGQWQMWLGVGLSFVVSLLLNKLLTRNKFGLMLIDPRKLSQQFSFDTEAAKENFGALMSALEKYFSRTKFPLGRKNFLTA
ncbi:MAG: hypothetical protein IJ774_09665, partial [Selenomonadaceae bacterium]|nr:hypothetical protein [Selenomonadaceae bacterium]